MAMLRKPGSGPWKGGRGADDDGPRGSARRRGIPRAALAAAAVMMLAGAAVGAAYVPCCARAVSNAICRAAGVLEYGGA